MEPGGPMQAVVEDDMYIKDGDYVVFDEHGDKKALVHIKPNGYVTVAAAGGWNMQGPSTCYKPPAQHNKAATSHNLCKPSSGHKALSPNGCLVLQACQGWQVLHHHW